MARIDAGRALEAMGRALAASGLTRLWVGYTANYSRYSRDQSFSVLRANWSIMFAMAAGSIVGAFLGGLLLVIVPSAVLLRGLAAILVISAVKVWRHE